MNEDIRTPKKLIEVALPLDDINAASAHEKAVRQGHPSTLHLWWARRPLAAARAVLFAQLVNDPGGERGYYSGKTKAQADAEREELFDIIRGLVRWENTNNEEVLQRARAAIVESWRETCELNKGRPGFDPEQLPAFHDPFAGGGAIPLEAQRLGLEAHASDLNPVAVLINKAMVEIPPRFAGYSPVGPVLEGDRQAHMHEDWPGATGLAEDVRRYGHWVRRKAFERIGHLYPNVRITKAMAQERGDLVKYRNQELPVIAWLWARTVNSPSPVYSHVGVPLVSNFVLSTKKGKEAWVETKIKGDAYEFRVGVGPRNDLAELKKGTKLSRGAKFRCILSGSPIEPPHIKSEGKLGRMGSRLMAVVVEGERERVYLSPTEEMEAIAASAKPTWTPDVQFAKNSRHMTPWAYGLDTFGALFTSRQLVALNTFSEVIRECCQQVVEDATKSTLPNDSTSIGSGGAGGVAYGEAVALYLSFALSKMADLGNSLCGWEPIAQCPRHMFGRQAIPMVWDFAEANPFSTSSGSWRVFVEGISKAFAKSFQLTDRSSSGMASQVDASTQVLSDAKVVSTDPPYYDNVPYADLADFFYLWMRRTLRQSWPNLFRTITVPKAEELVADSFRHGSAEAAERFFMDGMSQAIRNIANRAHPAFPVTIYYAFKQSETRDGDTSSAGWVAFLEATIGGGFCIDGTWPLNTENASRMRGQLSNALASSVVLVCRRRGPKAGTIARREFQRKLREEMPDALSIMIGGKTGQSPIAPVDLAQAAIGPGMAIFSRFDAVLNQDGSAMSVSDALVLINRAISDFLSPVSGNFDADTQFCANWFDQYGWSAGPFGEAQVLAQGKGTTVDGVRDAKVVESGAGKVRLFRWREYPSDWSPDGDSRTPIWEVCHHLMRALDSGGESEAGLLLARMPERGESIRALAYHLFTLCERKSWADDARSYNELIAAWHAIVAASHDVGHVGSQTELEL